MLILQLVNYLYEFTFLAIFFSHLAILTVYVRVSFIHSQWIVGGLVCLLEVPTGNCETSWSVYLHLNRHKIKKIASAWEQPLSAQARVPTLFLVWELKIKKKILWLEEWQFYKAEINNFKHSDDYLSSQKMCIDQYSNWTTTQIPTVHLCFCKSKQQFRPSLQECHALCIHPFFLFSDILLEPGPFLAQPGLLSTVCNTHVHGLVLIEVN